MMEAIADFLCNLIALGLLLTLLIMAMYVPVSALVEWLKSRKQKDTFP